MVYAIKSFSVPDKNFSVLVKKFSVLEEKCKVLNRIIYKPLAFLQILHQLWWLYCDWANFLRKKSMICYK